MRDMPKPEPKPYPVIPNLAWRAVFLAALREYPVMRHACEASGVDRTTAWKNRNADPEFAAACDEAMQEGIDKAEKEAYRRAVHGWHEPVIHQGEMKYQHVFEAGEDGKIIPKVALDENGQPIPLTVNKFSDPLLQFVLKGRRRGTYGDRTELTGAGGGPVALDDTTRNARLAALLAAAQLRRDIG